MLFINRKIVLVLCGVGAFHALSLANSYYVSPSSGSDSNPGTLAAPFQTFQMGANTAVAGDTVYLEGGVYREAVVLPHSGKAGAPIQFQPYGGAVSITGCNQVTGWTQYQGSIYRAPLSADLGASNDQVFCDNVPVSPTRYPLASTTDLLRPDLALAGAGTNATTIYDSSLTDPAGFWVGANIWLLRGTEAYDPTIDQSGVVTASAPGVLTIQMGANAAKGFAYSATQGSQYVLTNGPLQSLRAPNQYWIGNGYIYLWTPGGDTPVVHDIEVKERQTALNFNGQSYILLNGVVFRGTAISLATSQNCTVQNCVFSYVTHFSVVNSGWNTLPSTGVVIGGSNNILTHCMILDSAANGVSLSGSNNTVTGCLIRDCDYVGEDSAGILANGTNQTITNNSIYECGRDGIHDVGLQASLISMNDFSLIAMLTQDAGGIYSETNGAGTTISYNWFHDFLDAPFTQIYNASGIYLDGGANSHLVHHNAVWNIPQALVMNGVDPQNSIVCNNFCNKGHVPTLGGDVTAATFVDNIISGEGTWMVGNIYTANLAESLNPQYTQVANYDFQLMPTSPALGTGVTFAGVTTNPTGVNPDIGAYQTGCPRWTPGATTGMTIVSPQPTGLSVAPGNGSVTVSWGTNNTSNPLYRVYMRCGRQRGFKDINYQYGNSYVVPNLTNGVTYEFTITQQIGSNFESPHVTSVYCAPSATAGLYEAQGAQLTGSLATKVLSGSNYAHTVGDLTAGSAISFNGVNGGSGGTYSMTLRYINPTTPQPLELIVNGVQVNTLMVPYTPSGFANYTTTVTLNPGSANSIELLSAAGSPLTFDSIQIG